MKFTKVRPIEMHLAKMEGAGNSFLLTWDDFPHDERALFVRKVCDSHFGVGADGFVFLTQQGSEFAWDFYNNDGSAAEFCGNAARCVAQFIKKTKPSSSGKMVLKTIAGMVECEVKSPDRTEVQMPDPQWVNEALTLPMWPRPVTWLNTGVPHLVVPVPDIDDLKKYKSEAALMRSWLGLGPGGSNVTFVYEHSPEVASAVSFERGVEDFTLACGTGAVAAAVYLMKKNQSTKCLVQMPGGDLEVFHRNGKVVMAGSTREIATMTLNPENHL